jgi:ABC-type glycerol-3-phosphate transport system permease component
MVGHWNSWFDASIYLDASHQNLWPLQLYTKINLQNTSGLNQGGLDFLINNNTSVNDITMQMALTIVTILPMLIIYPIFQKYFTKGVYLGAVKG